MLSLAAPIMLLCVVAPGICLLKDRCRARNGPGAGPDGEASVLVPRPEGRLVVFAAGRSMTAAGQSTQGVQRMNPAGRGPASRHRFVRARHRPYQEGCTHVACP